MSTSSHMLHQLRAWRCSCTLVQRLYSRQTHAPRWHDDDAVLLIVALSYAFS